MNRKRNVKQFILTNGQEIICDVIEWAEENFSEIVVRNCMEIVWIHEKDTRIYMFKPWMHYQESGEDLIVVNSEHIVSTAAPTEGLAHQYDIAVKDMNEAGEFRKTDFLEERQKRFERLAEYINDLRSEYSNPNDSDGATNIIPFPPLIH